MQRSLRGALSILGREALKIVLPSWCVACEKELPMQERVASCCRECWDGLPKITAPKCRSCALPLPVSGGQAILPVRPDAEQETGQAGLPVLHCLACVRTPLPLDWCDAWGEYDGGLARLLHALKFQRHDFLDDALASLLEETLRARGDLAFDAIAGVPMSRSRERRRGYNQAELLGRALSLRIGVRCDMTLLARRGERATQSTLPKRARAANVKGLFAASSAVKGQSILLIDDICTTGETLRACAGALASAGAARVCALAVARRS